MTDVSPDRVTLRPATVEDESFLRRLYATTRSQELSLVDWDEAQKETFLDMQFRAQLAHYRQHFPRATHHIILYDGRTIGRIYVKRSGEEIRLLDITLLPPYRSKGIGTHLMEQLLTEATQSRRPVRLYVWQQNAGAQRWYKRLGFHLVHEDGYYYSMEWHPPAVG